MFQPIGPHIAALLLLLLCGTASAGQKDCPFSIGEAIDIAEQQLAALFRVRGVSRPSDIPVAPEKYNDAVESYLAADRRSLDVRPSSFVAYIARDEDVCVIYSRYDGRAGGGVRTEMMLLERPASAISDLIDSHIDEFLRGRPPTPRAPLPRDLAKRSAIALARGKFVSDRPTETILGEIGKALFPASMFADIEQSASLSIVPALNMGRVPFSALDLDGDGHPLVENVVINVEASLKSVLDGLVYRWVPGLSKPVVFGDPDATNDPEWILPRLPGASREAQRVSTLMGIDPIVGKDATKERLLGSIRDADYIHIAAHGLASEDEPMDKSFLALTSGRLTAREIQGLALDASPVVVLSACQSALGGPLSAGIIGVTRAFQIAGASNVVSSLWNIDDTATTDIMSEFSRQLLDTSPVEALRRAQMAGREKWPDPRIWSAFVVFGPRISADLR